MAALYAPKFDLFTALIMVVTNFYMYVTQIFSVCFEGNFNGFFTFVFGACFSDMILR